jgi:hypothetical protein
MEDPQDVSPETEGVCVLCGQPLGGDPFVMESADSALITVCARCATHDQISEQEAPAPESPPADPAREALSLFQELIDGHAKQAEDLRSLTSFVEELLAEVAVWRSRAETLRDRYRALEAEAERVQGRLRRAEDLLSVSALLPDGTEGQESPVQTTGRQFETAEASAAAPAVPLTLEHVRAAQRYFNETRFVEKLRSVRRSLGPATVSLQPAPGPEPRILITAAWDIVWYQYLVIIAEDMDPEERVTLFGEGMELSELAHAYKMDNASLDDHGRVDASELEVSLLAEGTELLTDMPAERAAAIDDATEEIWEQRSQPEFRWDD